MAIIIEQEEKSVNWVAILSAAVIVAVIFLGAYLLFFKKPELIEVVVPGRLQEVSKISQVAFDPASVLDSPTFKLLKQYGGEIVTPSPGRNNPFRPF